MQRWKPQFPSAAAYNKVVLHEPLYEGELQPVTRIPVENQISINVRLSRQDVKEIDDIRSSLTDKSANLDCAGAYT